MARPIDSQKWKPAVWVSEFGDLIPSNGKAMTIAGKRAVFVTSMALKALVTQAQMAEKKVVRRPVDLEPWRPGLWIMKMADVPIDLGHSKQPELLKCNAIAMQVTVAIAKAMAQADNTLRGNDK